MCSVIITRNIFIVNPVHTVLQDLLLPWMNQNCQLLQLMGCYFDTGTLKIHVKFYMNTNKFCMNMNKLCMNMHDQNFRVCSRYLGHVASVWNRHPNFCGSVWRPYHSTQNMWSSFTSIIITYTVASTFIPQPLLWKSAIFAMNKYICLWREKG